MPTGIHRHNVKLEGEAAAAHGRGADDGWQAHRRAVAAAHPTGQPVVAGVVGQADVVVGMVEPMGVEMGMRKIGANGTPAKKPYVIALLTLIGAALAVKAVPSDAFVCTFSLAGSNAGCSASVTLQNKCLGTFRQQLTVSMKLGEGQYCVAPSCSKGCDAVNSNLIKAEYTAEIDKGGEISSFLPGGNLAALNDEACLGFETIQNINYPDGAPTGRHGEDPIKTALLVLKIFYILPGVVFAIITAMWVGVACQRKTLLQIHAKDGNCCKCCCPPFLFVLAFICCGALIALVKVADSTYLSSFLVTTTKVIGSGSGAACTTGCVGTVVVNGACGAGDTLKLQMAEAAIALLAMITGCACVRF